jgi:hypothetical protein
VLRCSGPQGRSASAIAHHRRTAAQAPPLACQSKFSDRLLDLALGVTKRPACLTKNSPLPDNLQMRAGKILALHSNPQAVATKGYSACFL